MPTALAESPAKMAFSAYVAEYMKAAPDFIEGTRRGIAAVKEGRVRRWAEVRKELGLD